MDGSLKVRCAWEKGQDPHHQTGDRRDMGEALASSCLPSFWVGRHDGWAKQPNDRAPAAAIGRLFRLGSAPRGVGTRLPGDPTTGPASLSHQPS